MDSPNQSQLVDPTQTLRAYFCRALPFPGRVRRRNRDAVSLHVLHVPRAAPDGRPGRGRGQVRRVHAAHHAVLRVVGAGPPQLFGQLQYRDVVDNLNEVAQVDFG